MPLRDYSCKHCNNYEERLVKREDEDEQICECDHLMERVDKIGKTGLQFKGRWYKTTKSY